MSKFKVGDEIKIVHLKLSGGGSERIGQKAIIEETDYCSPGKGYKIMFEDGVTYTVVDEEITINKKQSIMKTLGIMMKKILDGDTQKLVKAGYINGDLELTDAGQTALFSILFTAHKAELVTMAQELLDEEKADK